MGTWGANILGNDTSCEIYESFLENYHNGLKLKDILKNIEYLDEYLDDRYTKYSAITALCLAKYETGLLTKKDINKFEQIVHKKDYLLVSKELDADKSFLKEQQKHTEKLLAKIKTPKKNPKKRKNKTPVPPPKSIELPFKTGACLSFQLDGKYFGLIVLEHKFFETKGELTFAFTTIKQDGKPTFKDFQNTTLQYCQFYDDETYLGFGEFYVADVTGDSLFYTSKRGCSKMTKMMNQVFEVIGYLPGFNHLRISSFSIGLHYEKKIEVMTNLFVEKLEKDIKRQIEERKQKTNGIQQVPCHIPLKEFEQIKHKNK